MFYSLKIYWPIIITFIYLFNSLLANILFYCMKIYQPWFFFVYVFINLFYFHFMALTVG